MLLCSHLAHPWSVHYIQLDRAVLHCLKYQQPNSSRTQVRFCGYDVNYNQIFAPTETTLTLQNIDKILIEVLDWHILGTKLGLPVYKLEAIRIDCNAYGTYQQRQKMITTWLEYDTEASWDKLANALEEMGKNVAAAKIWNTYVTGHRGKIALVSKMSMYI